MFEIDTVNLRGNLQSFAGEHLDLRQSLFHFKETKQAGIHRTFKEGTTIRQMVSSDLLSSASTRLVVGGKAAINAFYERIVFQVDAGELFSLTIHGKIPPFQ